MQDEHDNATADLLRTGTTEPESDKAGRSEFTIAGFGTGTVAELEAYIAQIKNERDTLQKKAHNSATQADEFAAAVSYAAHVYADELRAEVAALTAGLRTVKTELESMRRDLCDFRAAIWGEIEHRVRKVAVERADIEAGGAIWAKIEDLATDTAAASARSVIRDELVVNVDLI